MMKLVALTASLLSVVFAQDWGTVGVWEKVQPVGTVTGPVGVPSHNPTFVPGLILIGGVDSATNNNATWQYDIIKNTWTQFMDLPVNINAAYMFSIGGAAMIIDEQNPNAIYAIDTVAPTSWTKYTLTGAPQTRIGCRFINFGSYLFLFGGMDDPSIFGPSGVVHNDIWGIDLQNLIMNPTTTLPWVQLTADNTPGVPTPPIGFTWTAFGAHTVIMGGLTPPVGSVMTTCIQTPSLCQFHGSIWFFAPGNIGTPTANGVTGNAFQILAEAGAYGGPTPAPRCFHAAGATGDQLYVYGGLTANGFVNDLWAYNLVSQTWAQVTQTSPWPSNYNRGAGVMIARAFYVYAWDGKYNSLWRWFPVASSGANTSPAAASDAPHPGTVAGLVIAALLGVANLVFVVILYRRSTGSQYVASPIPGDVYSAVL